MPFFSEQENILQLNVQQFDFNIQFEQLFFSIIPSALFIVTSLWRAASQLRKPTVVDAPIFRLIKLGFITAYFGLDICLLVLVAVGSFRVTSIFIASSVLKLVSTVFMIVLSLVDHSKSPRPSVLLNSYLFLTLLLDAAQARTFFLASHDQSELNYSSIFVVAIAIKVGILLLEAQRKTKWVRWDDKEHSPEESSGIFSLGVYFWLNRIFFDGYKKVLTIKDLYPLDSSLKAESLHEQFSKNLDYSQMKGDKYGLVKVLLRTLRVSILLPIPPRLALLGFTFAQPFFIERLLGYLTESDADPNIGYGFIGASFLIYFGIGISTALYWYFHHRMRAMARSALVTEIFLKATKVRIGADDDSAALTLMSTDIERINMGLRPLHDIWASIIQVGIASWMLYNQLGVVFVAPMGLVALCSIGLGILMNFTGDSQRAWMAGVQKRVGLTATVIANMKNLKISGLSGVVGDFVQKLRVEELAAGARFRRIFIVAALLGFIPMLIAPPLTFAFAQRTLDVSRIFTSLSWLLLLTNPLGQLFQSIPEILSALACLGRIQAFLETENRQEFRQILDLTQRKIEGIQLDFVVPPESDELVIIKNGRFGWKADEYVLRDINTRIARASLTIVVGPVGSGKSTFCKTLIGEIPFNEGSITLSNQIRHVGFCDQVAFLSNGSIRENIVGFSAYDEDRYADIIQATSLNLDLETLPQGDRTNIGSDGITLSGGQKQRVALARALYLQTDLLILDDVFSGLDADTEEQVYRQVFGPDGLLRQRRCTVVLCTHSIKHIPAADYIIALGGGTIAEQGTYSQLVAHQGYIQRLGLSESPETSASSDKSISEESMRKKKSENLHTTTTRVSAVEPEADILRQVGNKKVYIHYFKSMGLVPAASGLLCSALLGFFTNFSTIWLKYWSDDAYSEHPAHSYAFYAGIYALLQVCAILSLLLLAIAFVIASVKRAGANLHRDALRTLIRAPLRFFTTTDTGVTTNLFSQDLNLIDTELPMALLNTLYNVFEAIGQAAVMITSSPFIAISYPFLAGILYLLQMFYLRTSRQLRLLDLEAKSPMYTHFLDTLKGIATLRAFGFIPEDLRKNIGLLNASQRPAYLLVMIQQWLSLVLDLVVMMMSVILTTLAVKLHSNAGFMGASLVTLMNFGESLSGIVIFYTQLETSIGAISRLKTFNESVIPEDQKEEDIILPEQWPQNGVIELKGISASYNMETEQGDGAPNLALRNIKLAIKSGEKIAICGRTGSGKSSLVALLLKLLDPTPETLKNAVIDDVPLYRINRSSLRQRIIAVPQEAVFLPDGSTFKTNIDPLDISTAEECKNVLSAMGMIKFVQERGGLDAGMSAGSLSAGQRQLLSLGRALLRRRARARSAGFGADSSEGGILLLDEVSSSVDHETERVMQEIIRTEFKDYTVVAVSHRLDMIMDFDRVVVMDTGEIVEVGNPIMLSQKEGSRFGDLVKAGPVRVAVTGTGEIMQRKTT